MPRATTPGPCAPARALGIALAFVALALPALAGCLRPGVESIGECESPVGEDGPGFVRHAYYARFEGVPEGGARFVVPMPLDEESEPAPVIACLLLHDGDAEWRVVREGDLPFLEVTVSTTSAVVRASYLIATFSNESLADTNWSIAPLDRALTGAPAPPSGSKSAFPIGETRAYAGVHGAVMRVYYAVDAGRADDGGEVAHRQDVLERRTQAGWQSPVVFREHQTLR